MGAKGVESNSASDFAKIMASGNILSGPGGDGRLAIDPEGAKNGLAQLVLALVRLLHELLERQAVRRIDSGSLSDEQIERLGLALMKQAEQLDELREAFGLEPEDLNLDLGPLGKLW